MLCCLIVLWSLPAAASLNPPNMSSLPLAARQELNSRLVVAIVLGIHSGGANVTAANVDQLHVVKTAFTGFLRTVHPGYVYRYQGVSCAHQVVCKRVACLICC